MANTKLYEMLDEINQAFIKKLTESNPFEALGSIPVNFNTGKHYTKFNRLHLSMVMKSQGYKTSHFLTFKQICAKGGCVITGEKSHPIFFTSWVYKFNFQGNKFNITAFSSNEAVELANKKQGVTSITKNNIYDKYCFTKYFNVFNLQQSEGIEYEEDNTAFVKASEVIEASNVAVRSTSGLTRFNSRDNVLMLSEQTETDSEYYPEVFKALGDAHLHSLCMSGEKELEYAERKMVTHIAAAFLSQSCGLKTPVIKIADPSLIEEWLEQLNESYYFLWRCATKAQQIHDSLLETVASKHEAA
jgi:antirestriction protein ArdC